MRRPPGGDCCRFFSSQVRSRRTPRSFRSNFAHSTTACSIVIWLSSVSESIRRRLVCLMVVGFPLPYDPRVTFLLHRRYPKYRDSLLTYQKTRMEYQPNQRIKNLPCHLLPSA